MKMLCVKSAPPVRGWHDGLKAGEVYNVEYWNCPHCWGEPRALAEESPFKKPALLGCRSCGEKSEYTYVPWGRDRFIPFDPDKLDVTEKDSNDLYLPEKETTP